MRSNRFALLALLLVACDQGPPDIPGDAGPRDASPPVDTGPAASCDDGVANGDETSVDCGGTCDPCEDGAACREATDCQSAVCGRGFCLVPSCTDGVRNGGETGTDCGGDCGLCPGGEPCTANDECLSDRCRGGTCAPSSCEDRTRNGTETDVDCGGDLCPPCAGGLACLDRSDCESLICASSVCTEPACNDSVQNQDETSVDCGGAICPGCRDGLACDVDADCENGRCFDGGCVSCEDRIRNAEETAIDCGGPICDACISGETCVEDRDCLAGSCNGGICESCDDGTLNQDETDVDCGGAVCGGCVAGQTCTVDGDCDMGSCSPVSGTCVSCIDGLLNQDETDVDCGGAVCLGCGPGYSCSTGADCASGVCTAGACVGLSPNPTFQITSFTDTACATVDHEPFSGDDHGGIAVSDQIVLYTGDDATTRYGLDLSAGAALVPGASLVGVGRDAMVSNARDGTVYLLADAAGPKAAYTGGSVTRLIPMNADGSVATAGVVTLSTPITVSSSGVGLFSGYDRIVVHDGTSVQSIALPSGAVTNLGAMTMPSHSSCENWAYWGIAETDGATTRLVYVDGDAFRRVEVPTGAVSLVAAYTDLSDMCSFSPSLSNGRFYFHHEYTSQFIAPSSETVGWCPATYDTAGGRFVVSSMSATGCAAIDHASLIGDDRGGVAVSASHVYVAGDGGLGRWALDLTGGISSGGAGIQHEGLVSDVRTGTAYTLGTATGPIGTSGGTVTRLIELDPATGYETTREVTLSAPITLPSSNVGLFSGWNRILVHDGSAAWRIELPAGTVTSLGAMASPSHQSCETWAYWGITEHYAGMDTMIAVDRDDIVRYEVPSGTVLQRWPFTNLSDMCSITFSPHTNRWYFHHEGSSQFTTGFPSEVLGYCRGVYGNP